MTIRVAKYIKENIPYYGKIKDKSRYTGVKAKSWSIISDFTRVRDFIKFGVCVATGHRFGSYREGQGGHYYSMGGHGVYSGFSVKNVHLQSGISNKCGGQNVGHNFGEELKRRYGMDYLDILLKETQTYAKDDEWFHVRKIEEVYSLFQELKNEYPDADFPEYV